MFLGFVSMTMATSFFENGSQGGTIVKKNQSVIKKKRNCHLFVGLLGLWWSRFGSRALRLAPLDNLLSHVREPSASIISSCEVTAGHLGSYVCWWINPCTRCAHKNRVLLNSSHLVTETVCKDFTTFPQLAGLEAVNHPGFNYSLIECYWEVD